MSSFRRQGPCTDSLSGEREGEGGATTMSKTFSIFACLSLERETVHKKEGKGAPKQCWVLFLKLSISLVFAKTMLGSFPKALYLSPSRARARAVSLSLSLSLSPSLSLCFSLSFAIRPTFIRSLSMTHVCPPPRGSLKVLAWCDSYANKTEREEGEGGEGGREGREGREGGRERV